MKILYVTSNGGIHDYRFIEKLTNDYEVLLLHYEARKLNEEIKKLSNLKIISKQPFVKSFPLFSELQHFKKVYDDFKPDIVHTGYAWQVGILAARLNIHPHLSMPWGSDILVEPDKYFFLKPMVRKVLVQCDHIHCDAHFVKKRVVDDYNIPEDKVTVFPRGIDLQLFKPIDKSLCRKEVGLDENVFTVLFNRHLNPIYGVNDLLEGFKLFSINKNDVVLLMLSDGIQRKKTEEFINKNCLNSKINIIGNVHNAMMPYYLNACDVYISTSLSDGSSLSLLEALATGKGIIVTDVPSLREWVSDENGIVIPLKNPVEIAKALEKYYTNRQLIKVHGDKNIKIAQEKANWDKNYLKLKEIYSKIV